jgi:uncharacterized membrane-anchored protein YhcB (DUF1043 family)
MIAFLIGLIIGFIAGALVFRNNAAKAEKLAADTQATIDADKAKAKSIIDALKSK